MKLIDRTGQRYHRLTVTSRAENLRDTNARWNCKCDCGRMVIAYGGDLARGKVKSCGCLNAERIVSHGQSRTRAYDVWKQIFQRCENPKCPSFKNYGARGISVDPKWRDFAAFIADMGHPPKGGTLERIDNNGDYGPGNCKWASYEQQGRNRRNNNRLTAFGKTQPLSAWVAEYGLTRDFVWGRLRRNWTLERALTEPPNK